MVRQVYLYHRKAKAERLIGEGQDLASRRLFLDSRAKFREAFELIGKDQRLRNFILVALEHNAAEAVDLDWRAAEALIQQIQELEPGRVPARDLRSRISARRRDEVVNQCLLDARKMEAAGHLDPALATIEQGLSSYPEDPRLLGALRNVREALQELQLRQARDRDLNELRDLERNARSIVDIAQLRSLLERAQLISGRHRADNELQQIVAGIVQLMNMIEKVRGFLFADEVANALALCAECSAKYPSHLALQTLKAEIEDRQRQIVTAFLDEVDRRLAADPNLEKRAAILERALQQYPDEIYLQQALSLVREEQMLVGSIADSARADEISGKFVEALEKWTSLRTIYRYYPGLESEIERITQLRDQAWTLAKSHLVDGIEQAIERGDLSKAGELLRSAKVEFANDAAWDMPGARLQEAVERKSQAERLLSQGQKLIAGSRLAEGMERLGQAYDLGRPDVAFLKTILDTLVRQARSMANSDWRSATALLEQARALDAGYALPKDLIAKIEGRKRDSFVEECLAEVRKLKNAGSVREALEKLDRGVGAYPEEKRLLQERKVVQELLRELERLHARDQALADLQRVDQETRTIFDPPELQEMLQMVRGIAGRFHGDKNVRTIADELNQRLECIEKVRVYLAKNDLAGAMAACRSYLANYPAYRPLEELKAQIEDRQRERVNSAIDDVARRLTDEPDLKARKEILEDALGRHPDEPYFREELNLVRDQQNLVDSIIEQARSFEKSGKFRDASEQWERLRAIYRSYPDLETQIQRLARLEGQQRDSEKALLIKGIEDLLTSGDLRAAADLVDEARAKYPEDQKFIAAAARLEKAVGHKTEASRLLAQARTLAETEPGTARELLDQIPSLDPHCAIPRDILDRIAASERDQFVQRTIAEAKKSEALNDFQAALRTIEAALARHPKEPQLAKFHEALKAREKQAQLEKQVRDRDLRELQRLKKQAGTASNSEQATVLYERAENIAAKHPSDPEMQAVAEELSRLQATRIFEPESPAVAHKRQSVDVSELASEEQPRQRAPLNTGERNRWLLALGTLAIIVMGSLIFFLRPQQQNTVTQVQEPAKPASKGSGQDISKVTNAPTEPPTGTPSDIGAQTKTNVATVPNLPVHETGTMRVDAGQEGASIYLNDKIKGRTNRTGSWNVQIEPGTYIVRIEKEGFRSPPPQKVSVLKQDMRKLRFELTPNLPQQVFVPPSPRVPNPKNPSIEPPPANAGNPTANMAPVLNVPAIEVGKIVDPKHMETLDWEKVSKSKDISELDRFRKMHPDGEHFNEAGQRIQQLKSEQASNEQQDQVAQLAADKGAIKSLIQQYAQAHNNRDWAALKAIWNVAPIEELKKSWSSPKFRMQLNPADPVVEGHSATITVQGSFLVDKMPHPITVHFRLSKDPQWHIIEAK